MYRGSFSLHRKLCFYVINHNGRAEYILPSRIIHDKLKIKNGNKKSTRRDSNPRPSPWQCDTPPLSHSCMFEMCYLSSKRDYITNIHIVKNNFNYSKSFLYQMIGDISCVSPKI